jgi:uncharacterized membrane protein
MHIFLAPLLGWLGSFGAKFLTDSLLKFTAYKILLFTLLTVTLPIVLKNFIVWLFQTVHSVIASTISTDGLTSNVMQFTGLLGYLASQLQLVDCISVIITACTIKFTLKLIPFVG